MDPARRLWNAENIGITDRELRRIKKFAGHPPEPGSYRRRFLCPICQREGAIETYRRGINVFDLTTKPRTVITPLEIRHRCGLQLDETPKTIIMYLAFVTRFIDRFRGGLVTNETVGHRLLKSALHPNLIPIPWGHMIIEEVISRRTLGWQRTEQGIEGAVAIYRTLTQAASATIQQHNLVVAAQLTQDLPHSVTLLNKPTPQQEIPKP